MNETVDFWCVCHRAPDSAFLVDLINQHRLTGAHFLTEFIGADDLLFCHESLPSLFFQRVWNGIG